MEVRHGLERGAEATRSRARRDPQALRRARPNLAREHSLDAGHRLAAQPDVARIDAQVHAAIAAEDMMQAFYYHHLVAASDLLVRVMGPQRPPVMWKPSATCAPAHIAWGAQPLREAVQGTRRWRCRHPTHIDA